MMINFNDLKQEIKYLEQSNVRYYNLDSFEKLLLEKTNINVKIEDMIITPYYINSYGVLELYDYELNIRNVEHPNFEQFLLSKTGKTNIEDINPNIVEKSKNCYIEIISPQKDISIEFLNKYIEFVKNSSEISERVFNSFNEFDTKNLYFEFY